MCVCVYVSMKSFNIYSKSIASDLSDLQFQWWSNAAIKKTSVMEVIESEDLNSPLLGAQIDSPCATCALPWEQCPGHFGHYSFLFGL